MSAKKTTAGTEETKKEETAVSEKEAAGGKTENPRQAGNRGLCRTYRNRSGDP